MENVKKSPMSFIIIIQGVYYQLIIMINNYYILIVNSSENCFIILVLIVYGLLYLVSADRVNSSVSTVTTFLIALRVQFPISSQLKFSRHQFSKTSHVCYPIFCSVSIWASYSAS